MNNPLRFKPIGITNTELPLAILSSKEFTPTESVQQPTKIAVTPQARCIGCIWRTPQKYGGRGILCLPSETKDGECPDWVIKNVLDVVWKGRKPANFYSTEVQMEAHRL